MKDIDLHFNPSAVAQTVVGEGELAIDIV